MTQTQTERIFDARINHAPSGFDAKTNFSTEFYNFLESLHLEFSLRQQALAQQRREVLENSHQGNLPNHLTNSEATESDWKIELLAYIQDQRNQMTGPADDAELVVKMMNSGEIGRASCRERV